jgi:chemotaxis protein methyltransferase CheR
LVDIVVPRLAEEARSPIKIWSAACASGEEPLTIAMALELAGWFDRIPIEIYASDGSQAALFAAKKGIYRERCFRSFPKEYRDRFFVPLEGNWKIKPCLHQRIQWRRVNLADENAVAPLARVPVIFCRNVFIYFSQARILKTVKAFEKHMCRPGYLFLGAAESLLRLDVGFELCEIGGAFVYRKN